MSTGTVTVAPATPLAEAAARMKERCVGSLLVVEQGRPIGILTERDLLRAVAEGAEVAEAPCAGYMTCNPATVPVDASLSEAAEKMVARGIRHLPVVSAEGRLLGMLSIRDVVSERVATTHAHRAREPW